VNVDCIEWINLLLEGEVVYRRCKHNGCGDILVLLLWLCQSHCYLLVQNERSR
jgi:hypothetical protein